MEIYLDPNSVDSYKMFLAIKALPAYRFVGRVARIPDEYASRLGINRVVPPLVEYDPMSSLFDYQRDMSILAIRKRKFAIFARPGLGKTLCMLEFARYVQQVLGSSRRVLILSPLMVIRQTIAEAEKFYGAAGINLSLEQVRAKHLPFWTQSTGSAIGITNYEALTDDVQQGIVGALICDECFISGTLVDTPSGPTPIESLRSGDHVLNAFGIGTIVATKSRQISRLIKIRLSSGKIMICSENHPFFSLDGLVRSSKLKKGDYLYARDEALRVVQQGACSKAEEILQSILFGEVAGCQFEEAMSASQNCSRTPCADERVRVVQDGVQVSGRYAKGGKSVLQSILLGQMEDESTGTSSQGSHKGCSFEDWQENSGLAGRRFGRGESPDRSNSQSQSDQRSCGEGQNIGGSQGDETSATSPGRQWQAVSFAATNSFGVAWGRVASRISDFARQFAGRLSNLLQGRFGKSISQNCCRNRRIQSCCNRAERVGSEERGETRGDWVESVEILEQGCDEFNRLSSGKDTVILYDLQIDNHPSFSIEGILVHNSSIMKSFTGKSSGHLIRLGAGLDWKLCLTGTPAPNDRVEFANHAVFLDQFSTTNAFLARYFVNKGKTNLRWEIKPHAVGPFYRDLSHWCIFLNSPATYGWKDNAGTIPPINIQIHDVELTSEQKSLVGQELGTLFAGDLGGIVTRSKMSRLSKGKHKGQRISTNKPKYIRDLVDTWINDESCIIWCRYNDEQDELEKWFPEAASIKGATPYEKRADLVAGFQAGKYRVMISKPEVLGLGLNLQVATRQVFSSCDDCYDETTEVLTRKGWSRFDAISVGQHIGTVNPSTLAFEWQSANRVVWSKYSGDMIQFSGRGLDLLVTPNHRMWVNRDPRRYHTGELGWQIKTAESLMQEFRVLGYRIMRSPQGWESDIPDSVEIERVGWESHAHRTSIEDIDINDYASLVGWYLSEGYIARCAGKITGRVVISQSDANPEFRQEIIDLLYRIGANPKYEAKDIHVDCLDLAVHLSSRFGEGSYHKFIPSDVRDWPRPVLMRLAMAALKGDGHKTDTGIGFDSLKSHSQRLRDDFQEIFLKLGWGATVDNKYLNVYISDDTQFLNLRTKPVVVPYDGFIGCCDVDNSLLVVRRNGKACVSGNSYEDFVQAIMRSNRVGSTRPLNVHLPVSDVERPMLDNVLRKAKRVEDDMKIQEELFSVNGLGSFDHAG